MKKSLIVFGILLFVGVIFTAHAEKLNCPWQCTTNSGNDNNILWDYTPEICLEAFTTAQNEVGPSIPTGQRYYAGRQFRDTWMGTGWTGWWHLVLDYCMDRGLWVNAMRNGAWPGQLTYGQVNTVTFQVVSNPELEVEELDIDGCNEGRICLRGRTFTGVTRTMNSPFIYFDGVHDGLYQVRLNSDSRFTADPAFNASSGWDVVVEDSELFVDGVQVNHLFYELETPTITLSRKGRNFSGAQALLDYLEGSDFFDRLGLDATQKQNSIAYVVQNLSDKPYYYLTVLDADSIEAVSGLGVVDEKGQSLQMEQQYFAVYPSRVEVETSGDIQFPEPQQAPIKEYGEIVVKPHMHIFWK